MADGVEVAVLGAGVVGCAVALALARRGVDVSLLEAESEPGFAASGTNSGILHNGFDSVPGELETEMLLASAALREEILDVLGIPVLRCGAVVRPADASERVTVAELAENAARNGVHARVCDDGTLEVPGEAVTDPVHYTLALAAAAERGGAQLRMDSEVVAIEMGRERVVVRVAGGEAISCRVVVNCAGLHADAVARLVGDDSFAIFPRKGEFLVFEAPGGARLERILLPVPTKRTKGVLVFPTIDGKVVAGPTAVDLDDKRDWTVRAAARDQILAKAVAIYPPLEGAEPIAAYAGLRPAGRDGANYVIGISPADARLINVASIRSTGLSASLGIAQRVVELVGAVGLSVDRAERKLSSGPVPLLSGGPWWQRSAAHYAR